MGTNYNLDLIKKAYDLFEQALVRNVTQKGCWTLDLAARGVRINNRKLLCVRVNHKGHDISISAKNLAYFGKFGRMPDLDTGVRKTLYPICFYKNCVNADHLKILGFDSHSYEAMKIIKYNSNKKSKLLIYSPLTTNIESFTFTSLDEEVRQHEQFARDIGAIDLSVADIEEIRNNPPDSIIHIPKTIDITAIKIE